MAQLNLTKGSIFSGLMRFSLPMIAGNIMQQVYNLADTLIVGKFIGADALASVGSAYALMIFITSIIIGLCMGSGAFFSADYGEIAVLKGNIRGLEEDIKDQGRTKKLNNTFQINKAKERTFAADLSMSFWFIFAVTIVIYLIIYPGMKTILKMLQTPPELMESTGEYVTIVFAGIIFVFIYNFFAYFLRSIGDSVTPLFFLTLASLINIMLDIWLVAFVDTGIPGVAVATVVSQAFSGIGVMIYANVKYDVLNIIFCFVLWDFKRFREITISDILTSLQQSVMNFGILMIQSLVNSFGTVVMAAFAVAVKVDTLAYMPAQEFGNAYSLFVSQNYGASKEERIRKGTRIAVLTSACFCFVVSLIIFVFAEEFMQIFVGIDELEIILEGARYLRIEGAAYVGIGMLFLWYGYFRGIGRSYISLILTVISLGIRVGISYALAPNTSLGVFAIWCSIPIGWLIADIAGALLYKKYSISN